MHKEGHDGQVRTDRHAWAKQSSWTLQAHKRSVHVRPLPLRRLTLLPRAFSSSLFAFASLHVTAVVLTPTAIEQHRSSGPCQSESLDAAHRLAAVAVTGCFLASAVPRFHGSTVSRLLLSEVPACLAIAHAMSLLQEATASFSLLFFPSVCLSRLYPPRFNENSSRRRQAQYDSSDASGLRVIHPAGPFRTSQARRL